jgi:hypothetical protein
MSPEQARGVEVDGRADLFSLGLVIFYCLTGDVLYHGNTTYELLVKAATGPGPEELARIAALPAPCAELVGRALQVDPAGRYATAAEFGAAVAPHVTGGVRRGGAPHAHAVRRRLQEGGGPLRGRHPADRSRGLRPRTGRHAGVRLPVVSAGGGCRRRDRRCSSSTSSPPSRREGPAAVYRTTQPCRALGELDNVAVVSGSLLSPALTESGLLDDADILVLGEAGEADLLPVVDARRRAQRLTVYEIEGHVLSPPPGSRTAERARDLLRRSMPPHLARHADCLQLATQALDARFGFLNARRAVFQSQLWDAPEPASIAPRPHAPGRVVIGWGWLDKPPGGAAGDRARVARRAGETPRGRPGAHGRIPRWLPRSATCRPSASRSRPAVVARDYLAFLDTLDIGLGRWRRPSSTAAAPTCASSSTPRTVC